MIVAGVLKEKGPEVVTVAPGSTLPEIAEIIAARRIGAVVVLDASRALAGIVSERDVVKAIAAHGGRALAMTADDIMTRNVVTATPATTINEAIEMMEAAYFRHLPVLENGAIVGIISVRDVVRARMVLHEHDFDSLRAYVHRGG